MNKIVINNRIINQNSPVFIIAEIGINHNGNFETAKKMILEAKKAGADAVKFQTYKTELFVNKKYAPKQFEILKKYELNFDEFYKLKKFSDENNITFISSPFDMESLKFLIDIKISAIKIASSELSDIPLIKTAAKSKLPMIISTGLHYIKEIDYVINKIRKYNKKLILLHCVSDYPLSVENANLNSIKFLSDRYNLFTGFSDHSQDEFLDIIAVSLGAKVIEKHFTLNKRLKGGDNAISIDIKDFKLHVEKIRAAERALGKNNKTISKNEKKIRKFALKGIYTITGLKKNKFEKSDKLITQRPLKGIPAIKYDDIVGQVCKFVKNKN